MSGIAQPAYGVISSILGGGEYVSVIMAIFYATWGWLGIHSEVIAATHVIEACNETDTVSDTVKFVVFSINSCIIGFLSILTLFVSLVLYMRSLCKAWDKYKCASSKNPRSERTQENRSQFFKCLVIEIVGTYAAIYLLDYLDHNTDYLHADIHKFCKGNWLERWARTIVWINNLFACGANILSYVFAYYGMWFCARGLILSFSNSFYQSQSGIAPSAVGNNAQSNGENSGQIAPANAQINSDNIAHLPTSVASSSVLPNSGNGAQLSTSDNIPIYSGSGAQLPDSENAPTSTENNVPNDGNAQLPIIENFQVSGKLLPGGQDVNVTVHVPTAKLLQKQIPECVKSPFIVQVNDDKACYDNPDAFENLDAPLLDNIV